MKRFVQRVNGVVRGVYANPQPGYAEEELDEAHPDVAAYMVPAWSKDPLLNRVRAARVYALNAVVGIMTTTMASLPANPQLVADCLVARQALLNLATLPDVIAATNETELATALILGYEAIKVAAPVEIKNAFASMNL